MFDSIIFKALRRIQGYCRKHYDCDSCRLYNFCKTAFAKCPQDWRFDEEPKEE